MPNDMETKTDQNCAVVRCACAVACTRTVVQYTIDSSTILAVVTYSRQLYIVEYIIQFSTENRFAIFAEVN